MESYGDDLSRALFAQAADGSVVGTVTAWQDDRQGSPVRSLHWLAVDEAHQRQGIGRALVQSALKLMRRENNAAPVYLHTQPWSWKAILLYIRLGFRLQRKDSFAAYVNEYNQAMAALRPLLDEKRYALLEANSSREAADFDPSALKWNEQGLIPAIAQDASTGEVLMLAWMNQDSLRLTIESGFATYYSRSRQQLWRKGETSGHTQRVIRLSYDCDGDAILMQVAQTGPACHTGKKTCFHNPVMDGDMPATAGILNTIEATIADRAANPKPGSYTNYLLDKGIEKICKKVGEEATETVIAAMKGDSDGLAGEAADLLYHLAVLLHAQGVEMRDVWEVLRKRHT
jgi:phosphoribosyl-ATP pyrophosphohydrolase/phosphoribosyl-AMP cyclohydrolase